MTRKAKQSRCLFILKKGIKSFFNFEKIQELIKIAGIPKGQELIFESELLKIIGEYVELNSILTPGAKNRIFKNIESILIPIRDFYITSDGMQEVEHNKIELLIERINSSKTISEYIKSLYRKKGSIEAGLRNPKTREDAIHELVGICIRGGNWVDGRNRPEGKKGGGKKKSRVNFIRLYPKFGPFNYKPESYSKTDSKSEHAQTGIDFETETETSKKPTKFIPTYGRPKHSNENELCIKVGFLYYSITGIEPKRWGDSNYKGPFVTLIDEIFRIMEIKINAEHLVRTCYGKKDNIIEQKFYNENGELCRIHHKILPQQNKKLV